jgi:hypothetical protein
MKNKLRIILVLMAICSLFAVVNSKEWVFLYEFEMRFFSAFKLDHYGYIFISTVLVLSHAAIILMPLLTNINCFRYVLVIAPLIFVISLIIVTGFALWLLIPFIMLWWFSIKRYNLAALL